MENKNKIILDLCGGTGAWGEPYKENGYDVKLITLPNYDVRKYIPPKNVYGILAAPPCTEFSIAREGFFFGKKIKQNRDLNSGMIIVNECIRIIKSCNSKFYAIENPVGVLRKFLGDPDFSFQPWEFGNPWTKRTLIWGDFNKPIKKFKKWEYVKKIKELYIRPGREKPSIAFLHKSSKKYIPSMKNMKFKNDAEFRAVTPQGFAKAFYEANK